MSLLPNPLDICKKVASKQLTKNTAIQILISLIEESESERIRAESIIAFSKLAIYNQKIFKILENCLVSDNSSLVRMVAVRSIYQNFPKKDIYFALNFATKYENSVIVVKQLFDLFNYTNDPLFILYKNELKKRLEEVYDIIADEIELVLNLGILYIEYTKEYDLDIYSSWFKIIELLKKYPDPKGLLSRLAYLRSGGHRLKPLNKSSISLSELRKTYFNGNESLRLYQFL